MSTAVASRKRGRKRLEDCVIRLKIPPKILVDRDWSAPVERKFFPNDRAEVVTVNLDQPNHSPVQSSPYSLLLFSPFITRPDPSSCSQGDPEKQRQLDHLRRRIDKSLVEELIGDFMIFYKK